jgi:hypothetical protein
MPGFIFKNRPDSDPVSVNIAPRDNVLLSDIYPILKNAIGGLDASIDFLNGAFITYDGPEKPLKAIRSVAYIEDMPKAHPQGNSKPTPRYIV